MNEGYEGGCKEGTDECATLAAPTPTDAAAADAGEDLALRGELDGKLLRELVEAAAKIVDKAQLNVSARGIYLKAMDDSRVAMIVIEIPTATFAAYTCNREQQIGVDLAVLKDIIRRCYAGNVQLELDMSAARLRIRSKGKGTKTFSLPLIMISDESLSEPKIPMSASATMPAAALMAYINDAAIVSSLVTFNAIDDRLEISASGDNGDLFVPVTKEDDLITMTLQERTHASYSLNYLVKMASLASENVTISFSTNYPMHIKYNMENGARLEYWLAPRVEENV